MYDVMRGVRVVELAEHTFAPAAAMVLADWGADVIKVERTDNGGDPARRHAAVAADAKVNPFFDTANRGKRAIAIDLLNPAGRAQFLKLVAAADVFVTSLREGARRRMGIEPSDLMALNPRLIYARATGYGLRGPLAQRAGFDLPSSWCYGGAAYMLTPDGGEPTMQPGSVGDLSGAMALAGAIAAALFRRERTGAGAIVDNSLYLTGAWIMCQSVVAASAGTPRRKMIQRRTEASNALVNFYRTRDDRWLNLCLTYEAWWPGFARHLGREDLLDDPRFADSRRRVDHSAELIAELDATFATKSLAEWSRAFEHLEGAWAPVQNPAELIGDAQAVENGFVVEIPIPGGGDYVGVASPAQFDEQPVRALRSSPLFAQHTDEILRDMGVTQAEIAELRSSLAIV